ATVQTASRAPADRPGVYGGTCRAAPCRSAYGWWQRCRLPAIVCSCSFPFAIRSVTHRLAGLHHAHDAFLRLRMRQQFHEGAALAIQQPLFIDQAAVLDLAAGDDVGDHHAELVVMRRDETAVTHVDQLRTDC